MHTVKDISIRLNVSQGAVYKLIRSGSLQHHRFGAALRVSEEQLQQFLEQSRRGVNDSGVESSVTGFRHL